MAETFRLRIYDRLPMQKYIPLVELTWQAGNLVFLWEIYCSNGGFSIVSLPEDNSRKYMYLKRMEDKEVIYIYSHICTYIFIYIYVHICTDI